ncbi:hypothetical protein H4219_005366, partial [Mycoemilia scoparia]
MSFDYSQLDFGTGTTTAPASEYISDPSSYNNNGYPYRSVGISSSSAIDTMTNINVAATHSTGEIANDAQHEITQRYSTEKPACDPVDHTDEHNEILVTPAKQRLISRTKSAKMPNSQTLAPVSAKRFKAKGKITKIRKESMIPPKFDIQLSSPQLIIAPQAVNGEVDELLFYSVPLSSIEKALSAIQIDTNSVFYQKNSLQYSPIQLNLMELFRLAYKEFYDQPSKILGDYENQNFELNYLRIFAKSLPEDDT